MSKSFTFLAFGLAASAAALATSPPQTNPDEEYRVLDAVEGSFVNLATFPVRPMAFDAAGNLWALNHHDSTVRKFSGLGPAYETFRLPWGPSGIALWRGPDAGSTADDVMVITCRGTWAVVELSVATGEVLRLHQLRPVVPDPQLPEVPGDSAKQGEMAEPGDIVIVGDLAYVSCTAADSVIEIDLATNPASIHVYAHNIDFDAVPESPEFLAKAPLFLSVHDGNVYVAPWTSGNNTLPFDTSAVPAVSNLPGTTVLRKPASPAAGLPDRDLFRIDPVAKTLEPVARGMGTVMFAHGVNPASDPAEMWMLNTDALNDVHNSEPEANGRFSENRVARFDLPSSPVIADVSDPILLDPDFPGALLNLTDPIGQPFSLTFLDSPGSPVHGHAFLCGLLTNNVLLLDAAGAFVKQWHVGDGAIPRQVLLRPSDKRKLAVYCWGDNKVRVYNWTTDPPTLVETLPLGYDPTPAPVAAGRTVFFDASHSRHLDSSCATCHIEGMADQVVWNLSNLPIDDKGPMLTQTLVGIERLAPFHWRGERDFGDFHGAFKGLLGKEIGGVPADIETEQFLELQEYVFSLTSPANPHQSRDRVLDDGLPTPTLAQWPTPLEGHAVNGQVLYHDHPLFNVEATSCNSCHPMPTGTGADIVDEFSHLSKRPRRINMKPSALHELWRKESGFGMWDFGSSGDVGEAAWNGAGFGHNGTVPSLFHFIRPITGGGLQNGADVTAFVHQADQGLGQAAHYAFLLEAGADTADLTDFLLPQARGLAGDAPTPTARRNCDIVIFGTVWDGTSLVTRRWFFDRNAAAGAGVFRCEDPTFPVGTGNGQRTLADFIAGAEEDGERNLVVGLPVGMGERFGVDFDSDGHYNLAPAETDPEDPAVPGAAAVTPNFVVTDPLELPQKLWQNSRTARLRFDTDVLTRYEVFVWPAGSSTPTTPQHSSAAYSKEHTVVIGGLWPSTAFASPTSPEVYFTSDLHYNVRIDAIPRAGTTVSTSYSLLSVPHKENTGSPTTPAQVTREQRQLLAHILTRLDMETVTVGSNFGRVVEVDVAYKRGGTFSVAEVVHEPADGRVIIGRAFLHDTVTLETKPLGRMEVDALGSAYLVDEAYLNSIGASTRLVVGPEPGTGDEGVLLVSRSPTVGGTTTMGFELLVALGTNEKVIFGVEAVVCISPTDWTPAVLSGSAPNEAITLPARLHPTWTDPDDRAWAQWSFPDTREAGAQETDQ